MSGVYPSRRVPCTPCERHKLNDAAVPTDQQVRRYLHATDLLKVWVRIPVQPVREQRFDFRSAEFAGRQADAVDDDHRRLCAIGSRVTIGAVAACRLLEQPGGFVYGEEA